MHKWIALITGPTSFLAEPRIERLEITQEELEECREEGESDEEVIEYILEEWINEWEQRCCKAQVFTLGQYKSIDPDFQF